MDTQTDIWTDSYRQMDRHTGRQMGRDRQTCRQTHADRWTETDRHIDRLMQTDGQTHTDRWAQMDRHMDGHTDRQMDRLVYRQMGTNGQTHGWTHIQTDGQTETDKLLDRHKLKTNVLALTSSFTLNKPSQPTPAALNLDPAHSFTETHSTDSTKLAQSILLKYRVAQSFYLHDALHTF